MNYNSRDVEDIILLQKIRSGEKKTLEIIFTKYYVRLCRHALKIVERRDISEEIVQELFIDLWKKRESLPTINSLSAYLHTSVKNRSINYVKSANSKYQLVNDTYYLEGSIDSTEEYLNASELEIIVASGIKKLPPQCRNIFILNRHEGLTYKMIAEKLNISQKTVETQMAIAIKRLKESVEANWGKILLILILTLVFLTFTFAI